jgi:RHS repeat-associated protein
LNPGNRTFEGDWTATPSQCSSAANPNVRSSSTTALSSNQVSGYSYDAAGNVTNDGVNQYLYDAEGRICAVASTPVAGLTAMTGYIYDAEGTRVAKGAITTWSCDPAISGFTTTNDYIIGPSGEQMTEMGMGGVTANGTTAGLTWQHTNAWAGGKLLATYDNDGLHFYLDDPLGSRRVQTDYEGVVERTCASLPFGDVETCAPTPTEHLFTGKERDAESGNDYFEARYYSSAMGRFMSPDWSAKEEPIPYSKMDNPQSFNLYSYVWNNPLTAVDDDGHQHMGCSTYECHKKLDTPESMPVKLAIAGAFTGGAAWDALGAAALLRTGGTALAGLLLGNAPTLGPIVVDAIDGYVNPTAGGRLTIGFGQTKLNEVEIDTGVRLAQQTGEALAQGTHACEEFVDSFGRTYDAVNSPAAFANWAKDNGSGILANIKSTAIKDGLDFVAVDLKGASKAQIGAIKDFVKNSLTKVEQNKIVYVK